MDDIPIPLSDKKIRLTEQLRHCMRIKHLSYSTEKTYLYWILNFIRFHDRKHPSQMGATEVDSYLSYLAMKRKVAPQTQALALNALIFLYHRFLEKELGELNFVRPRYRKSHRSFLRIQKR